MRVFVPLAILIFTTALHAQSKYTTKSSDLKSVIKKLATWVAPEKGDFETWDQYFERLPVWDSSKVLTLVEKANSYYNIDDSSMTFWGPLSRECEGSGSDKGWRYIIADYKETLVKTYTSQNGYGRKVKVKLYKSEEYRLDSVNFKKARIDVALAPGSRATVDSIEPDNSFVSDRTGTQYFDIAVNLNVPPEEAKKYHEQLDRALEFKIVGYHRARTNTDYLEPTMSSPTEINVYEYYVNIVPIRLVYFHRKSKEIFCTLQFN